MSRVSSSRSPKSVIAAMVAVLIATMVATSSTPALAASPLTWTKYTATAIQKSAVTFGNGVFVAVSQNYTSGGAQVMTSTDGQNWTGRTAAASLQWQGVTYGNGLFVAVATSGTGNRVMTSPDGVTWTSRTSAVDRAWGSVTYGNGLFVAVAYNGNTTNDRVMTSPDGITWTNQTQAANNSWKSVTYGNGLFVAVSSDGTNRVMTSPDGITWTSRTAAAANYWQSVTYGNGVFVAVSVTGTGNRVMTSTDGINWNSRSSAADNQWTSVTYGNGLFVAVANNGTGNRVMTSPDGITWTIGSSAADDAWISVTYGNGLYVAVANTTPNNQVMISGSLAIPSPSVTVTASSPTSVYGGPLASVGYTPTPALATDDWFPSLTCGAYSSNDTSTPLTGTEQPSTYKTICTGSATTGKGIPITYVSGTYALTKAPITVSAASKTKTYGDTVTLDTATDWSVSAGGLVNGDTWASKTLTVSGTPSGDQALAGVGSYTITPGGAISGKTLANYYNVTTQTGTLTVNKATLTVTPNNQELNQGDAAPSSGFYTFTITGFRNGDTSSVLTSAPSCTSTYAQGDAGTTGITCSGGSAANYTFQYGTATLTVTPPKIIITANSGTSVYGSSLQTVASPPYSTSYAGDSLPTITCQRYELDRSTPLTSASTPGNYPVICTGGSTTTDVSATPIEYVDGTYTITKAPLSISANNRSKVYGDTLTAGTNADSTITGLYVGDTLTVTYTYGGGDPASAAANAYVIAPTATLAGGSNCANLSSCYTVALNPGTLTVTPAVLHVNPDPKTVTFGAAAPGYTFTVPLGDWKNGDTDSALGAPIVCTSAYTSTTPVGTVLPITCTSGTASNYTIVYGSANLTVQNTSINVTNSSDPLVTTANPTGPVTLSASLASGSSWSAGCRVIWTLDPSLGTSSPYYAYPNAQQINDGSPVTLTVPLPIGVYNVAISLDTNCSNAGPTDPSGVIVVAPSNLGLGSTGGGWYRAAANGSPKQSFGYVMQVKKMSNPDKSTTWTYWGQSLWTISSGWRIKMAINKTVTQYSNGTLSGAQPWGTFNCPADTWATPAPNAACGSFVGYADLQQWVVSNGVGSWQTVGQVTQTVTVYDGGTLTTCKNKVCRTTDMSDWYGATIQLISGTVSPSAIPQALPVTISQGQIRVWK